MALKVLGLTPVSRLKSLVLSFLTHSQLPCFPLMPLLQHLDYFCRKSIVFWLNLELKVTRWRTLQIGYPGM